MDMLPAMNYHNLFGQNIYGIYKTFNKLPISKSHQDKQKINYIIYLNKTFNEGRRKPWIQKAVIFI